MKVLRYWTCGAHDYRLLGGITQQDDVRLQVEYRQKDDYGNAYWLRIDSELLYGPQDAWTKNSNPHLKLKVGDFLDELLRDAIDASAVEASA